MSAGVLPADHPGLQRVGQLAITGVEALGGVHAGGSGVAGLSCAVGVPGVGGVAVQAVTQIRLGYLGQQHAFAVIQSRPLSCDRHQLVELCSTFGGRHTGGRPAAGRGHFQVAVTARLSGVWLADEHR